MKYFSLKLGHFFFKSTWSPYFTRIHFTRAVKFPRKVNFQVFFKFVLLVNVAYEYKQFFCLEKKKTVA